MRSSLALSFAVLAAAHAVAQNPTIDMNLWTVEQINGTGPWTIDPVRLFAYQTNTVNTDVTTFYTDFNVTVLEFRMSIDSSGGDDDLSGFIMGWQPGDSSNQNADYVLVDWKKATQNYQDWGTAVAGLAISHVVGPFTRGYGGGPIDLWSHTGVCTELQRSPTYGSTGWAFNTNYFFRVVYTPGSVDVWLNGNLEFHVTGTFRPGRFACYNYSQSMTQFQFPIPGNLNSIGTGCGGIHGIPYLFSPATPYAGENVPVIVANLPPTAPAILMMGASNTAWAGAPLPLSLASYGAPGCTVYSSGDVLMPTTNYNGTAYMVVNLPRNLAPTTNPLFYLQGVAVDPTANALGIVLSNAAGATVGIR